MKEKFMQLAQKLGFIGKIKANQMTSTDWDTFAAKFQEEHGKSLTDAMSEIAKEASVSEEHQAAISALLTQVDENGAPVATAENPEIVAATPEAPQSNTEGMNVAGEIINLKKQIVALSKQPESDKPTKVATAPKVAIGLMGPGTNDKFLFGIPDPMFALDKSWNINAAKNEVRKENYKPAEKLALFSSFNEFAAQVSERFQNLFANGQLPMVVAGNIDYSPLEADLGAYYRVRRQDAIITFILSRPTVANIWPIRYGVQDEEVVVNMFEGKSYSQAYQAGRIFAGSFKFEHAKTKVKDVMFKYKFSDLKDLERQYIGYKNMEGSNPIKWSFIEWIMVQCAIIQQNEVEMRRVKGVRVEPTPGKAAHFMYASDGWLTTKDKYTNENRIYVLDSYKTYTTTTVGDFVRQFVRDVYRLRGTGSLDGMTLFMNALHVPDFYEWYREKYGKNNNYTGDNLEVKDFPLPKIVGVPNMGDRYDMWMAPDNAVEIHEMLPGEFFAYYFQQDMEELMVSSNKKEGIFAFAGRKFATKAELIASKGRHTNIFATNPVSTLAAGATTADALTNEMFETVNNAGATAFTDFTGAQEGIAYKLVCGGLTNATAIAKAAKFANITGAYTPTALGDYLKVIFNPTTSTFVELERKVGGVVTVNAAAAAPEYVESI